MKNYSMSKIRTLRKARSLTQQQLSQLLGISRSAVAMWETGGHVPTVSMLPRLAKALDCEISDLYEDEEEPTDP